MQGSNDLAGLFPKPAPGVGFRQGEIISWDANTGSNQVAVAGTVLFDVPILNTGEAVALKAGHIVGLLTFGGSWFILGRITPPNDPNFASATVAFDYATAFQQNFTVPVPQTTRAAALIACPAWADEVVIMSVATATLVNSTAARQEVILYSYIDGGGGSAMAQGVGPDSAGYGIVALTAVNSTVISDPPDFISCECVTQSTAALAANGINTATVNAIAVFRSTT
jgi:hypothetical protein